MARTFSRETPGHDAVLSEISEQTAADDEILQVSQEALDTECNFVEAELTDEEAQEIIDEYYTATANGDLVGLGSTAAVLDFEDKGVTCIKLIWKNLSIAVEGGRFDLLPGRLARLRLLEDDRRKNMAEIRRRKGARKTIDSNAPMREAEIQSLTRATILQNSDQRISLSKRDDDQLALSDILTDEQIQCLVPEISVVLHLSHNMEGVLPDSEGKTDGQKFSVREAVDIFHIDRVEGWNFAEMNKELRRFAESRGTTKPSKKVLDIVRQFIVFDDSGKVKGQMVPSPDGEELFPFFNEQMSVAERAVKTCFKIMHRSGISHQDVTSQNLMYDMDKQTPVIIDFGRSRDRPPSNEDFSYDDEDEFVAGIFRRFKSSILLAAKKVAKLGINLA